MHFGFDNVWGGCLCQQHGEKCRLHTGNRPIVRAETGLGNPTESMEVSALRASPSCRLTFTVHISWNSPSSQVLQAYRRLRAGTYRCGDADLLCGFDYSKGIEDDIADDIAAKNLATVSRGGSLVPGT